LGGTVVDVLDVLELDVDELDVDELDVEVLDVDALDVDVLGSATPPAEEADEAPGARFEAIRAAPSTPAISAVARVR
jgi:hypothetical protein